MVITKNKKAYHDYEVLETLSAGIALSGPEVKAVKKGNVNLKGSHVSIESGEAWIKNMHISRYLPAKTHQMNYDPGQDRKLLLKKNEINNIVGKLAIPGVTVIPLCILNRKGLIKVEVGIVKGKKKYDKRESIKKREFERRKNKLYRNY